jgi:hypothetical protein
MEAVWPSADLVAEDSLDCCLAAGWLEVAEFAELLDEWWLW